MPVDSILQDKIIPKPCCADAMRWTSNHAWNDLPKFFLVNDETIAMHNCRHPTMSCAIRYRDTSTHCFWSPFSPSNGHWFQIENVYWFWFLETMNIKGFQTKDLFLKRTNHVEVFETKTFFLCFSLQQFVQWKNICPNGNLDKYFVCGQIVCPRSVPWCPILFLSANFFSRVVSSRFSFIH